MELKHSLIGLVGVALATLTGCFDEPTPAYQTVPAEARVYLQEKGLKTLEGVAELGLGSAAGETHGLTAASAFGLGSGGTAAGTSAGFDFSPYGETFAMRVVNGVYHHEPEWIYNVSHAEEAARGQDGSGDLYSPGWISADLKVGETVEILGGLNTVPAVPSPRGVATGALESAAAE